MDADDEDLKASFRVWATSCAHVPADLRHGRESLARVIRQSEFYEPAQRTFPLRHPFEAPGPIASLPPFPSETEVIHESYLRPQ